MTTPDRHAPTNMPYHALLARYGPQAGAADQLIGADGEVRPHWRPFLDAIEALRGPALNGAFAQADRYLRDAGVIHRIYDQEAGVEAPLPLSHIPLVLPQAEWARIEAGIIQRADMMDLILRDLYGPQRLVREGHVPSVLVAGNPEFARAHVGVAPRNGDHLHLYGADLSCDPDGRWWVLKDFTEMPSGVGYTVENRIALSRAVPELYRDLNVRKLAGFFTDMRGALTTALGAAGGDVAIWSPGAFNAHYFEHAYLARYLNILLVEGDDLSVRNGRVYVRTIAGLRPIDVILRRVRTLFSDPLTFDSQSEIGVPGLMAAVRAGKVSLANALGAGILEAPAFLAFLPRIAETFFGEPLALPSIATWWCGAASVRDEALQEPERRLLVPAFGEAGAQGIGADLSALRPNPPDLTSGLLARGMVFAVQERAPLSTMPVWDGEGLAPRPFVLRVFAARTAAGWQVMPGGFCRVADEAGSTAISLQRGNRVADVWISDDAPPPAITLWPGTARHKADSPVDALPARAAENLFWLGRYLERAETAARLVFLCADRLRENGRMGDPLAARAAGLLWAIGAAGDGTGGNHCKALWTPPLRTRMRARCLWCSTRPIARAGWRATGFRRSFGAVWSCCAMKHGPQRPAARRLRPPATAPRRCWMCSPLFTVRRMTTCTATWPGGFWSSGAGWSGRFPCCS